MWYEVHRFQENLDVLKIFLSELASREEEIITFGLKRVSDWESYKKAKPIIEEFEVEFLEVEELSKYIAKDIHEQIKKIKNESSIIDELTTISVQLSILTNKKPLSISGDVLNSFLLHIPYMSGIFKHRQLFSKEQISIHKTLVTLTRLKSLAKLLEKIYRKTSDLDNEIFKPSKIDSNALLEKLDSAVQALELNNSIAVHDKERLIEYIISAKVEISGEKPNWNNTLGALVIVATLLGGVAVAPQAYDNITQAIQHILGVSIEKHIPNMLPPPQGEQEDEGFGVETTIT